MVMVARLANDTDDGGYGDGEELDRGEARNYEHGDAAQQFLRERNENYINEFTTICSSTNGCRSVYSFGK